MIGYAVAGDVVPAAGGTYVEGVVGAPRYLNPLLAEPGSPDDDVCALVFAGLTRVSPDGAVDPDLASGWSVSADGRIYTFRLRAGRRWHDGQPVVPQDVVATIRALQAADFPGDPALAELWRGVVVEAQPDGVRFTLAEPDGWFPSRASIGLLPAHVLARLGGQIPLDNDFNARPIGAGPFRVLAADLRRIQLALVEEPDASRYFLRGVDLRFFGSADAAVAALDRGELTGIRPLPLGVLPRVPPGAVARRAERAKTVMLVFNTRAAPVSDAATRSALARAIDRERLAAVAGGGSAATGSPGDIQAARAALAAAGWTGESGGPLRRGDATLALTIRTNDAPERIVVAEEIARQLGKTGARVDVQTLGWDAFVSDALATGGFQVALVEQFDPVPGGNPSALWRSGAPLNVGGWQSTRADELLDAANRATTVAERNTALRNWRAVFEAEAPGVPLYHPTLAYAVVQQLQGQRLLEITTPRDRFAGLADWYLFTRRAPGRF